MAEIRTYGTPAFDFNFTAKIVQIPIARNSADVQDIWNAISEAHADINSMDDDEIASVSGKEPLGGGQFVGLTLSLLNGWRLQAAARAGPDYVNVTVSGGNLVTSEADQAPGPPAAGDADDPIAPSAFVTFIISRSTSGTLTDRQDIDNQYRIESQRPTHRAYGGTYYWDPDNGSDTADGETPSSARATFTSIHDDLITSGAHDAVFIVPGAMTTTENITISKDNVSLRGVSEGFEIQPSNQSADTVTISGDGVEVSGINALGPSTSGNAYTITGNNYRLSDFTIRNAQQYGVCVLGSTDGHNRITRGFVYGCTSDGIRIDDSANYEIERVTVHDNGGDGISIAAAGGTLDQNAAIRDVECRENTGYGIDIEDANVEDLTIKDPTLANNTAGRLRDNGTNTVFSDDAERIRQIHLESFGRWKIDKAAGTLTLYDDDGTTSLQTFNLLDENGSQVTDGQNIYERVEA